MTNQKKKIFPKIKKKIKGFLTDESGKITKKDALGLAVGSVLLSGIDEISAAHLSTGNMNDGKGGTVNINGNVDNVCLHASGIVNGHYSSVPNANDNLDWNSGHASHASHGSY